MSATGSRYSQLYRPERFELRTIVATAIIAGVAPFSADAEILSGTYGTMQVALSPNIVLNADSKIERPWIVVNDEALPAKINGRAAPVPVYGSYSKRYKYSAEYSFSVEADISAIEIHFILFDVWGERTKTLSATEITEYSAGVHELNHIWGSFNKNEASKHYSSIGYIARLRLKDGTILHANSDAILNEAKRFSTSITVNDLAPDE